MKIGFQGTNGAYSEEALYRFFEGKKVEAHGLPLSEDVCFALENRDIAAAILPIENSIVGNVNINMDLLIKHHFYVIGEVYLPIQHCLMANEGVSIEDIKKVHSHPVALDQCIDFLRLKGIQAIPEFDTAGASKLLSEKKSLDEAAIGSSLCAKYYGLNILSNKIQKVENNFTRFLIFVNECDAMEGINQQKTGLAFRTKHHPGSLLGCLQIFADHQINLTKLESRPIPEDPFMYTFFVDFIGALKERNVQHCLQELKKHATHIKIIGSYPRGEGPQQISN